MATNTNEGHLEMVEDNGTQFITLPSSWYHLVVRDGVDQGQPGIYEWHIEGVGSYIGKYGRIRRPTREYGRNVTRLLNRRPYRRANPTGFRRIHYELADAHTRRRKITLIILENVPLLIDRNRREQELISDRGALNDPPYGKR